MRTIVLRVSQRANSRTITVTACLEVDGHVIPNARMNAAAMTGPGGTLDQTTIGTLVRAAKSALMERAKLGVAGELW